MTAPREPRAALLELVERWLTYAAVNAEFAKKHGGTGWFTVYDDRRDIYTVCACDLAAALAALEAEPQPAPAKSHSADCELRQGPYHQSPAGWIISTCTCAAPRAPQEPAAPTESHDVSCAKVSDLTSDGRRVFREPWMAQFYDCNCKPRAAEPPAPEAQDTP
jgi:hypothetical protein